MALILVQIDTVAPCGTILACASPADGLATAPQARQAEEGGSAGSGELSVTINKGDTQAGVMFESPAVGKTIWQAGTYTVRLNVTTAVADLNLVEVHVCRVNSSCVSQATVGSSVGLSISIGSIGVKTVEVEGAEQSAADTDRIYIVLVFKQTSHANAVFGFTPDQNIDTPITEVQEFVYSGDIPLAIVPDTPKAKLSKSYNGDIPLSALPGYSSILERAYGGDIGLSILPSYSSMMEKAYAGDVQISLIPEGQLILERLYRGMVALSILPDFPKAALEKAYGGDVGLAMTVNSQYLLETLKEFIYSGNIPLSVLPGHSLVLDRIYGGDIGLTVIPCSGYELKALIEVVKTVFLKSKLTERLVELKSTIKPSIVLNSEIRPEGEK